MPTKDIDSKYKDLIGKDMRTVMKALQLSPQDTVGKTFPAKFPQVDPKATYTALKLKTGDVLAFKDNKLSVIAPEPKSNKNPFAK